MVYDIDINELSLGPFRDLKFLDEMCVFCIFEQQMHNNVFF
jgi:hypothetical protein